MPGEIPLIDENWFSPESYKLLAGAVAAVAIGGAVTGVIRSYKRGRDIVQMFGLPVVDSGLITFRPDLDEV